MESAGICAGLLCALRIIVGGGETTFNGDGAAAAVGGGGQAYRFPRPPDRPLQQGDELALEFALVMLVAQHMAG